MPEKQDMIHLSTLPVFEPGGADRDQAFTVGEYTDITETAERE